MSASNWGLAVVFLLVGGCAQYGAGLVPGQSSEMDVETVLGEPTAVKKTAGGETILWYSKLPYGRESYAARIDPRGTLLSFEQRLTDANIAKLRPNASTADDVMEVLGPPWRTFKFPLKEIESWEYPVRTGPEPETLFVEVSPDFVVRAIYKLHDRDRRNGLSLGGFSFGF